MSRLLTKQEANKLREIINDYQLNPAVMKQFQESNFAVIAGPAGAGKDTLRNSLIRSNPELYLPILSTTTRPPRAGEADDQDYHFREVEEVEEGLAKREFFQAALVHDQQVSCLHISEVKKLKAGQTGLSILIPYTEKMLRDIKPDIKTVFLIPPNLEVLKERIQSERMLDDAEVERRVKAAAKEIEQALKSDHYYCLITDTVEHVTRNTHNYLQGSKPDQPEDLSARHAMRQIVLELSYER